ncbi:MAG: PIN domain-containing protein [Patescibacteria group bacterium]
MNLRVYLDTNIYCRPFDDWSQLRIALEAEAVLRLWQIVEEGKITCLCSKLIRLELSKMPLFKLQEVKKFIQFVDEDIPYSNDIKKLAKKIIKVAKIPTYDALHVSFAAHGQADLFLTCDDDILRKSSNIEELLKSENSTLAILNPIQFIQNY